MKHIGMATLGRDAEVRYLPDGTAVANLSLATNYFKKGAENDRETQWIDASMWGKQAESLAQYMQKGTRHCFVLSDMHIETYTDKEGYEAFKLVARVDSVELGPKRDGAAGGSPSSGGSAQGAQRRPAAGQASRPASQGGAAAPAPAPAPGGFSDMDDDTPF